MLGVTLEDDEEQEVQIGRHLPFELKEPLASEEKGKHHHSRAETRVMVESGRGR